MIYLTTDDLQAIITDQDLNDITDGNDALIDTMELEAIGEITGYLNIRYNSAQCFDRNMIEAVPDVHDAYSAIPTVLAKLADMTVYKLHKRIMPDNIPKLRLDAYDNAINWLEKVAAGYIAPELPLKETEPSGPLRYGNSSTTQNPYF